MLNDLVRKVLLNVKDYDLPQVFCVERESVHTSSLWHMHISEWIQKENFFCFVLDVVVFSCTFYSVSVFLL